MQCKAKPQSSVRCARPSIQIVEGGIRGATGRKYDDCAQTENKNKAPNYADHKLNSFHRVKQGEGIMYVITKLDIGQTREWTKSSKKKMGEWGYDAT